jgi:FMN-dependent oxidoreductase (nitrilotriacetate monooxygenase family)
VRNDKARGIRYDEARIHEIDFAGKYYQVKGPLNIARPPQGWPVLVQSGSSEAGQEFGAKWGELIFTAQQSLAEAQAFYRDVKSRAVAFGRATGDVKIAPGLCFVLGETEAQARAHEDELNRFIDQRAAIARLSERFGIDLSTHPLDEPLVLTNPKEAAEVNGGRSRHQLLDYVQREKPTLRRLIRRVAGGRGHLHFVGTPPQLADVIDTWFRAEAADGFNLMPQVFPRDLDLFVDRVVPELQRRGLFRTAYTGSTLREHLGLTRPAIRRAVPAAV